MVAVLWRLTLLPAFCLDAFIHIAASLVFEAPFFVSFIAELITNPSAVHLISLSAHPHSSKRK